MPRHTATTRGLPGVSPRYDDASVKKARGFHLGQRAAPAAAYPFLLRPGTAGPPHTACVAYLCAG